MEAWMTWRIKYLKFGGKEVWGKQNYNILKQNIMYVVAQIVNEPKNDKWRGLKFKNQHREHDIACTLELGNVNFMSTAMLRALYYQKGVEGDKKSIAGK